MTLLQVGLDVLGTIIDTATNTIRAKLGDVIDGVRETDDAEWWQTVGIVSRPPTISKGRRNAATQVVVYRTGQRDVVLASRDPLGQQLAGSLAPGETCIYASGADGSGKARVILKANGAVAMYTQKDGVGMTMQLDPSTNTISLINASGHGIIIDDDGVRLTAKDSGLTLGADGNVTLVGKQQTQVDGATVMIGSAGLPPINSALRGPTGLGGSPSLKVVIE